MQSSPGSREAPRIFDFVTNIPWGASFFLAPFPSTGQLNCRQTNKTPVPRWNPSGPLLDTNQRTRRGRGRSIEPSLLGARTMPCCSSGKWMDVPRVAWTPLPTITPGLVAQAIFGSWDISTLHMSLRIGTPNQLASRVGPLFQDGVEMAASGRIKVTVFRNLLPLVTRFFVGKRA